MVHYADIPGTIWFTGLSGAGKSTLVQALSTWLTAQGVVHVVLDGDVIRRGLCQDLGFSEEDRTENLRRVRALCALMQDANILTCVACITPMASQRQENRRHLTHYLEVFVDCALEICVERDPKGLYAQAIRGDIPQFTGISAPFEPPQHAHLTLNTHTSDVEGCLGQLKDILLKCGWIKPQEDHSP